MITGCSNKQKSISKTDLVLGTVVTINIYDHGSEKVVNKVFDKLKEIESKMTINGENSEVIGINDNAGKDFVKVSDETFYVIQKGKYFSELSKGRFDISIGTIVKLWNIGTEDARVPSQEEINTKKQLVNYHDVILNEEEQSVMLKQKGMILDLGGIAKGYAADAVAEILKENKVKHAIVNLGGNVFAYGNKLDGTPWKIGIQNPFSPREDRGKYIGVVNAANQTVVTSGVYERFLEKDGKYYHHILDPATGYPVENNLVGVSIIADRSIDADSLSTSAFSLGLEEGRKLIEAVDNVEAVFITKDQDVYITSGLKNNFQLTDTNFKLK
jgi:thiamine biosynthesis lipoprotein